MRRRARWPSPSRQHLAIDTAAKRKSCIGIALTFLRMGVIPDGTNLDAPQRLHTNFLYSGIAAGAVAEVILVARHYLAAAFHSPYAGPIVHNPNSPLTE